MIKYIIAGMALLFSLANAGDGAYKRINTENKIDARLTEQINNSDNERLHKIWVLFTDKELFDDTAYKSALFNVASNFSERSIRRRQMRKEGDLFEFADIPVSENYIDSLKALGFQYINQSRWLNAVAGYATRDIIDKIETLSFTYQLKPIATFVKRKSIETEIEPSPKISADLPDSIQSLYGSSYGQYNMVNVPLMHTLGYSGDSIVIAVLDTGFDPEHPALSHVDIIADSIFWIDDLDPDNGIDTSNDQSYHGTEVLSVLSAYDEGQMIGPAYNAQYIVASTEINGPTEIYAEEQNWVFAAEWAEQMGADIITSSLGYYDWYTVDILDGESALITQAANSAVSLGVNVFIAAGNERINNWYYIVPPADGFYVNAVGGVNSLGLLYSYSSAGPTADGRIKPDIMAQASAVKVVRLNTTTYRTKSGTSYASPIAAGAAAMLLEIHPDWSPIDLRNAMLQSGSRADNPDNDFGYGIFDVFKASGLLVIEDINSVVMTAGDTLDLDISVTGELAGITGGDIDSMKVLGLPLSAEFIYGGDGTASLFYVAQHEDRGNRTVTVKAFSGFATAETEFDLAVRSGLNTAAGPNPFDDSVTIFISQSDGRVENLSIFNALGEKVWEPNTDSINVGPNIVWHGINGEALRLNGEGSKVAPGVYFVYIRTEAGEKVIKLFKRE